MGIFDNFWTYLSAGDTAPPLYFLIAAIMGLCVIIMSIVFVGYFIRFFKKSPFVTPVRTGIIGSIAAVGIMALSTTIARFSAFITQSEKIIIYNEKAFVITIGFIVAVYSLYVLSARLVTMTNKTKVALKALVIIMLIFALFAFVFQLLANFITIPKSIGELTTIVVAGIGVFSFTSVVILMFVEARRSASAIAKLRLKLIGFAVFFLLVYLIALSVFITLQGLPNYDFINWIIKSFFSMLFNMLSIILFYWSVSTPLWLRKRSGVIPPSFMAMMKKKQLLEKKTSGV